MPGVAVGLVLMGVPTAQAHEHPSGITDLVTPAVVRVEAKALIDITLLDHVGELVHVQRSYEVPIGTGTGTVVNPDGTLVSVTQVVSTDNDLRAYAANSVFADHHKANIPIDFARHTLDDERLNRRLQLCYDVTSPRSTCLVDIKQDITIFPNVAPFDGQGFKAEVVKLGNSPGDPAVLRPTSRIGGGVGLPTAPLADKEPDKAGSPVSVAGFLGRPAPDQLLKLDIAHLGPAVAGGAARGFTDPQKKVNEPVKLGKLVDQGMLGAPVIGNKDGHVIGLLVVGGNTAKMIGVREITSALADAKASARRGPADAAFEAALSRFHTKNYTDAAPAFQRVLDLYPGQPVAAAHLKESLAKKGTSADVGAGKTASPQSTTIPLWPFIAGAAVVLALTVGLGLLWWRRRRASYEEWGQAPPQEPHLATRSRADDPNPTLIVRRPQAFPGGTSQPPQPVMAAPHRVRFCVSCGTRLGPIGRFCGNCGHPTEHI
ncbi:hypothetical protein GCM10010404_89520 [Nonomuraea africana]